MIQETSLHITDQEITFGREAVAVYRGWRDRAVYESESDEEAQSRALIIDSDLVLREDEPKKFNSLYAAQAAMSELANQLRVNPNIRTNRDFIQQKLYGSMVLMQVMGGEHVPFQERMRAMGVQPIYVPDSLLLTMNSEIGKRLAVHGIEHRVGANDGDRDVNRRAFEQAFVITEHDVIVTALNQYIEKGRKIEADIFPDDATELVEPVIVNVPEAWSGYVATDELGELFMKINTNPAYMYSLGELMTLAGHEFSPGHVRQLAKWREMVLQGTINPLCGIVTLHGQEATQFELFGQLGGALTVDEDAPDIAKIQNVEDFLKTFAYNNISYLVNTPGFSKKDVMERAKLWLPREKDDHLENVIEQRQDPMLSSYLMCYAAGAAAALRLLALEESKRNKVLRVIDEPCTTSFIRSKILEA